MATTEMNPLPRRRLQRGFSFLPLSVQITTAVLLGMLLIALLPAFLDPGRMTRTVAQAFHAPATMREATQRLDAYYTFAWRTASRPAVRRVQLQMLAIQVQVLLGGALAARLARRGDTTDDRERGALALGMPLTERQKPRRGQRVAPGLGPEVTP